MVHVEFSIARRHIVALAFLIAMAVVLIPGVSWATHTFTDVSDGSYFHDDASWMADAGITAGCNAAGTLYCPDANVTRGQMAAFLHRMSGSDDTTLDGRVADLEALLAGVSRNGDILLFDGMNLQIVNGEGSTNTTNSLGNVIIGYNSDEYGPFDRTGSHVLVVGDWHTYTSFAGIVAGERNTITGAYASVFGGGFNSATGSSSTVLGGALNAAIGNQSSILGGQNNTATGSQSSISGGYENTTEGPWDSVSGGQYNAASGPYASVSGGASNTASGEHASVSGGYGSTAGGDGASILGGYINSASGEGSTVYGGAGQSTTDQFEFAPEFP